LTTAEQQELLQLLEIRAREEAEAPRDDRTPIAELFRSVEDEAAEASGDPPAYRTASASHTTAVKRHTERLLKGRQLSEQVGLVELQTIYTEAVEASRVEGCLPAWEVVKPPAPPPPEPDPLERMRKAAGRRAPLARDELLDVVLGRTEQEQQRRVEERQRAAATEVVDKLADFRNQGPLNYPPTYPDS
jgi:hypothetical protein